MKLQSGGQSQEAELLLAKIVLGRLQEVALSPGHQSHLRMLVKPGVCHGVQMGEPSVGGRNHGVQPIGRLDHQSFLWFWGKIMKMLILLKNGVHCTTNWKA